MGSLGLARSNHCRLHRHLLTVLVSRSATSIRRQSSSQQRKLTIHHRCLTARKRRKRGAQPMYGTGWMAGQHGTPQYYGNNENSTPSQPAVNQNYYGGYNQGNDDAPAYNQYGGGQNSGYYGQASELQQPSSAYQPARGGEPVYSPPSGPPPGGKGDVIR